MIECMAARAPGACIHSPLQHAAALACDTVWEFEGCLGRLVVVRGEVPVPLVVVVRV